MALYRYAAFALLELTACLNTHQESEVRIINGRDASNLYPAVVKINIQTADRTAICSATFVTPTSLITAAHCLGNDPANTKVTYNGTPSVAHLVNPQYKVQAVSTYDVAFLKFANPLAPFSLRLNQQKAKKDDSVVMVGFGATGTSNSGTTAGSRRYGVSRIYDLNEKKGEIVLVGSSGQKSAASSSADAPANGLLDPLEVLVLRDFPATAPGDSGGPILTADGTRIIGIISEGGTIPGYSLNASFSAYLLSEANQSFLRLATQEGFLPELETAD